MLYAVLVFLCCSTAQYTVVSAIFAECEPSQHICQGACPPLPERVRLDDEHPSVCMRDANSEGCVCWLRNDDKQLNSVFQCTLLANGTESHLLCKAPDHCFNPSPEPTCLIIPHCSCLLHNSGDLSSTFGSWRLVNAFVMTGVKSSEQDGNSVEKVSGDIREFSLKHLLFLLGFVIAPLLCWCLLNFFHEGKCRKKSPQTPEAQPIPTSRVSTVDNMNNEDGEHHGSPGPVSSPNSRTASVHSHRAPVVLPTAPDDLEVVICSAAQPPNGVKLESPPSYFESTDHACHGDCCPPPTYEDAVTGSDASIQQMWQTVYVVHAVPHENS